MKLTTLALFAALEEVSEGVQVFDLTGQLIYANAVAATILGYPSLQDYLNRRLDCRSWPALTLKDETGTILQPDDFPAFQALQGRSVTGQVLHFADSHDRDRCCVVKALPIRDEAGAIVCGVVLCQDLRDRDAREHPGLTQLTAVHQQVTDAVPSMIAYLDRHERHHYANEAYLKAFGRSGQEVIGADLQQVVGPVLYQQLREAIHQANAGIPAELCLPLLGPSPQPQYKQVTLIPQQRDHRIEGFYLLLNDITAHKHTTDLLQNQAESFQVALEGAAVGIWDWNLATDEILWSQQQERLFGLRPGSFDGKLATFLELVEASDRGSLQTAIQAALKSHNSFFAEFRIRHSDGSVRWLSHRGQVFRDVQNHPLRLAGIAFDITAQKAAEEKLLQQVNRERLMAKISQDISRSHNLQEILQQVVTEVCQFMGVDRLVIIDLRDKMAGEVKYEAHSNRVRSMLDWTLRHTWIVKDQFIQRYCQGYPVAVTDVHTQPLNEAELSFLEYFQIIADLTVPLLENNELWGLLSVHQSVPKDWQPEDLRMLETLGTQVSTAIQRDKLHRELTQANQKLKRYAYLDGLTQVANRRRFEQFLNHEWRRLMREKAPLALIMADIDHFKAYNDVYGHQAGDECLRRVAGMLRSVVQRPADMVARYGGEEFVVVLPKTSLEGAETVAEKMRLRVRNQKIPHKGSPSGEVVTLSLGVAVIYPHPLKSPDELIQAADRALYQAKEGGRDRVVTA